MKRDDAEEAILYLFREHGNQVNKFAFYMLGNREEAADAVQEIFLRISKSISKVHDTDNLKAWMWIIARNHICDVARKNRIRKTVSLEFGGLESLPDRRVDPDTSLVLMECIAQLPLPQRQVVVLRLIKDLSIEESASILGRSPGYVRVALHRALQSMSKIIQGNET